MTREQIEALAGRTDVTTIAIPRRLVPEVLRWIDDEIALWPGDTAYQRDLAAVRAALQEQKP
jgi:hypothetical protein